MPGVRRKYLLTAGKGIVRAQQRQEPVEQAEKFRTAVAGMRPAENDAVPAVERKAHEREPARHEQQPVGPEPERAEPRTAQWNAESQRANRYLEDGKVSGKPAVIAMREIGLPGRLALIAGVAPKERVPGHDAA